MPRNRWHIISRNTWHTFTRNGWYTFPGILNLTDEESRIMPTSGGGFMQAFNAQACVDIATLLIVATHTTQQPNDKQQIDPAIEALRNLPEQLGQVNELLADTGYFSQANVDACEAAGISPLIAVSSEEHHQRLENRFKEPEPVPETADRVTKMRYRLKRKAGKAVYAKRKCTVEPVFGIIKSALGYRQFLRRGLEDVDAEWTLVSLAWNLKRMHVLAKPRLKKQVVAAFKVKSGAHTGRLLLLWSVKLFGMVQMAKIRTMRAMESFLTANRQFVSPTGC